MKVGYQMALLGAFTAALSWGTDSVLARLGLRRMHPALGTFLSLCAGLVFCLVALIVVGPGDYPLAGVAWFVMVGLINFLGGRQCNFRATQRLGAARAASLFATAPLVSISLAVLVIGERVSALLVVGALLTVTGVILVVRS